MAKSVGDALAGASATLGNEPDQRRDAALLLGQATGLSRSQLIAFPEKPISAQQLKRLQEAVEQRRLGQPMAYLLGTKSFWDQDFKVTAATLIPRPETELLIEIILNQSDAEPKTLIDLGTGSGAIAVTVAQARPNWSVIATDQSLEALGVAQHNGAGLTNLTLVAGNWLTCFGDASFDIIVANPPYIDAFDTHLAALAYEPRSALVSEDGGFSDLRTIIQQSTALLAKTGYLLLEHGHTQQAAVMHEMAQAGYHPAGHSDLAGNPRAVIGFRKDKL